VTTMETSKIKPSSLLLKATAKNEPILMGPSDAKPRNISHTEKPSPRKIDTPDLSKFELLRSKD